jgi:hypothetical protein
LEDDDTTASSIQQQMIPGIHNDSMEDNHDSDENIDFESENGSEGPQSFDVASPDAAGDDSDEVHAISPSITVFARFHPAYFL